LGNCDYPLPGFELGYVARVTLGGAVLVVVHDIHTLDPGLGDRLIVHGHSHRPRVEWQGDRLYVNPGSATQRRLQPSCSVGVLEVTADGEISARIVQLDDFGPRIR
jgi:predicted phosphodiesterase